MRSANIFDPIATSLDQRIFDGIEPRRSVIKFIERVYYHALDHHLGVTGPEWASLYLTGSLTTYQYSATSDCDVTVFPDYNRIWQHLNLEPTEARRRLIEMNINYLDGTFLPGTTHPLQFFTQPPGLNPEDTFQPGLRSGYDLLNHQWLVPPERSRTHDVQKEMPQAYERAAAIAEKMTVMLDSGDYDSARKLWHQVHAKRQLDQRAGLGDYSEGNIVYKWLLHEGLFDRIRAELGEYIAKVATDQPLMANPDLNNPEYVKTLWECFDALSGARRDDDYLFNFATNALKIDPQSAREQIALWKYNRELDRREQERKFEDFKQQQLQWRLEAEEEAKQLVEQYGEQAKTVLHLFDKLMPPDAPPFAGDLVDACEYLVHQGWQWKFIISRGHGAWVWADSETGDYNGLQPHSETMMDLMNAGDMPKPDPQNMALGWIDLPPLEEGDQAFTAIVRGGDGFSDDEIRHLLTLPESAEVDREGYPMRLQWFGSVASVDHLWDERVTTKVIYDFDKDRIVLGTQADLPQLDGDNKIVGEYTDGKVTLFEAGKQWINPTYFRRLWHVSYPNKALSDLYYRRDSGDEYKLKSLPRKRKKSRVTTDDDYLNELLEAFKKEKIEHVTGQIGVGDLKDPKVAAGLCHTFSLSFANFLQAHGFKAWLPRKTSGSPEAIGYDDRTIEGYDVHYWTYVETGDTTYGIDWTASQYGYDDFPVVQKLTESGWMREW